MSDKKKTPKATRQVCIKDCIRNGDYYRRGDVDTFVGDHKYFKPVDAPQAVQAIQEVEDAKQPQPQTLSEAAKGATPQE